MKLHTSPLLALTLSLALTACSQLPSGISQTKAPAPSLVQSPAKNTLITAKSPGSQGISAQVQQINGKEQLRFNLQLPAQFQTQYADYRRLAFVQFEVSGQGLSTAVKQDGAAYVAVSNGQATAIISNLAISNNGIRLVRAKGFDIDMNPLPSFEATAHYVSLTAQNTLTLALSRRHLLLGNVLASLLDSDSSLLTVLNLTNLQTVLEEAMGYQAELGSFAHQPTHYDIAALVAALPIDGSIPDAATLNTAALGTLGTGSVTLNLPLGLYLAEPLTLSINDPSSQPLGILRKSASGESYSLNGISPGEWTLEVLNQSGQRVGSTPVSVNSAGDVSFDEENLTLADVSEGSFEIPVNSYSNSRQDYPAIAMDADGDFVVTWQSHGQDESYSGIYAQRYNSQGSAQGSEFQVNTVTTSYQASPSIAMDSDGDFVVTWQSNGQDGSIYGVYARRYDSLGTALDISEFRVNTHTTDSQNSPSVAMDDAGDFVVTWRSEYQDGSFSGIYARRYDSLGNALDISEFLVNTVTAERQTNPGIAIDSDGDFVVTWQSNGQDGSNYGVYARRYDSLGTALDTSEFRVNTVTENYQGEPSITMDANGDFIVAWQGEDASISGVFARRYDSLGTALDSAEFRVNTFTAYQQKKTSIAMDADGDFVVTWQSIDQDGDGYGVYARRYDSQGGESDSSEFKVNSFTTGYQLEPGIAVDTDGNFAVIWQSSGQDGSNYGIYAQRYNAAGQEL